MENKTCTKCHSNYLAKYVKSYYRKNGNASNHLYVTPDGKRVLNNVCVDCATKDLRRLLDRNIKKRKMAAKEAAKEKHSSIVNAKEKTCSRCGVTKKVIFVKIMDYEKGGKVPVYKTDKGRPWYAGLCPDCRVNYVRVSRGHSARDKSKKPQVVRAVKAEKIAATHFRKLGFKVKRTKFYGPDLVCKLGPWTYTVEVKSIGYSGRSWRASKVTKARVNDDLVALVLPNNRVYIDSM